MQLLSLFEFQLKGDSWLFLVLKLQTSEPTKMICVKSSSIYYRLFLISFKNAQFQHKKKIKDYPGVDTQVNLAIAYMNVPHKYSVVNCE